MLARRILIPLAVLAYLAPVVIGSGTAVLRGKLLPDLPEHIEHAQRDLRSGAVDGALAHLDIVLMDRPVRYSVAFEDVEYERQPECMAAFRDAAALWEGALGKELQFVEVAPWEHADIRVVFKPDVKQKGSSVAGFVNWQRKVVESNSGKQSQVSAQVQVRTTQPGGAPMLLEHMRHTAAHELGHVMGLDDSPYYGDIMGPLDLRHPAAGFEATELENLRSIRSEAQVMRQQLLTKAH